ncbi:CaiB/BaiF CoA transferase family protein [Ureibacillus sinduriensis]|uniref:Carnitine dehydratase n=1 Tax=Ureibacillus sinduriensis BLB-1 = JCM 15800 TaxID=1384057 RepID=A0A0A3ITS2_9BACL|nr:CaiB/BaiF CoA-transferase family protein [Ureibacillus sinduriensis]KGR78237.1 carnitine dehydratase [Ureibacillus sinduriensis BLB-1 = JCM 15800]
MTILKGLKILDFSSLLPGAFTTMMFADYGADVIHVESSRRVEMMRIMPPYDEDKESYIHQHLNRSKKSLTLNLKTTEAVEIVKSLIHEYDIVIEGFRPGVMKRLGMDYATLKEVNPRLIFCSITGYGQSGPYQYRPGHDNNYLSIAGVLDHSRLKGKKPVAMGIQIADIAGGSLHAAVGVLAAALHREQTGEGRLIDVSMTDAAFTFNALYGTSFLSSGQLPRPEEEILNGGTFYDYYQTKDGRYFSVGSLEPQFRKLLCEALDIPELIQSTFNDSSYTQKRYKEAIKDAFLTKNFDEWLEIIEDFNGCVEPVLTFEEAINHPQIQARNMVVDVPLADGRLQKQIGAAIKFDQMEPIYSFAGAKLGEHTQEILISIGYSEEQIKWLNESGVLE